MRLDPTINTSVSRISAGILGMCLLPVAPSAVWRHQGVASPSQHTGPIQADKLRRQQNRYRSPGVQRQQIVVAADEGAGFANQREREKFVDVRVTASGLQCQFVRLCHGKKVSNAVVAGALAVRVGLGTKVVEVVEVVEVSADRYR